MGNTNSKNDTDSENSETISVIKKSIYNNTNIMENKIYPLIYDSENRELDRLTYQHYLIKLLCDDKLFHINKIEEKLNNNKNIQILECGCGTGIWSMEICEKYEYSNVIGIDINNQFPNEIKPVNCIFRILNILDTNFQNKLSYMLKLNVQNYFDFIYQKFMVLALKENDWNNIIQKYINILKPGGWIQFVETDLIIYNKINNIPFSDKIQELINQLNKYFIKNNINNNYMKNLHKSFKDNNLLNVKKIIYSCPIGKSNNTTKNYDILRNMMINNYIEGFRNFHKKIIFFNESEKEFEKTLIKFRNELENIEETFVNIYIIIGQKNNINS